MEQRRLVGRRYEDYIKNEITLELTPEEHCWRMIIHDPRYNQLMERRDAARRTGDLSAEKAINIFEPGSSFVVMRDISEE